MLLQREPGDHCGRGRRLSQLPPPGDTKGLLFDGLGLSLNTNSQHLGDLGTVVCPVPIRERVPMTQRARTISGSAPREAYRVCVSCGV